MNRKMVLAVAMAALLLASPASTVAYQVVDIANSVPAVKPKMPQPPAAFSECGGYISVTVYGTVKITDSIEETSGGCFNVRIIEPHSFGDIHLTTCTVTFPKGPIGSFRSFSGQAPCLQLCHLDKPGGPVKPLSKHLCGNVECGTTNDFPYAIAWEVMAGGDNSASNFLTGAGVITLACDPCSTPTNCSEGGTIVGASCSVPSLNSKGLVLLILLIAGIGTVYLRRLVH